MFLNIVNYPLGISSFFDLEHSAILLPTTQIFFHFIDKCKNQVKISLLDVDLLIVSFNLFIYIPCFLQIESQF